MAEDFLHVLKILEAEKLKAKYKSDILSLGMPSQNKLADLRTLSQLTLPFPPPLSPIRTNFNWDTPLPPLVTIRTICLLNFGYSTNPPPTHHQIIVFWLNMFIMVK